jgi:acyl transferase domain-containing protein
MSEQTEGLERIAIIGMAGRFPGAPDVAAFWASLAQGQEGISALTEDELAESGVSPAQWRQDNYIRAKGVLDGADRFDAGFFGYSPREAEILDPQHRVFLECAWTALESAGCVPERFSGRIGVFAGASLNTYLLYNVLANRSFAASVGTYQALLGSDKDFLATRAAYKLGLTGPAITVQTACSTSLTATHLACQSLLAGECDIALAGGVAVSSPLRQGYEYEPGGIASPDGHCRPFDAAARGTVPGNGVGVVVLRRLADALHDGDPVAAIILGSAVNNDGAAKAGYTAPSVDGQATVIGEALAVADVSADSIGYVETHGTGTVLGDPIEIAALTQAFRADTDRSGYCAIGSVKGNIGHLDAASGVTALIKTVLALQHQAIPPSLHFRTPNPELNLAASPFFVCDELRPWPRGAAPRRAGISSFGIGGTNVHLVLEEAAATPAGPPDPPVPLLPLSAKSPAALAEGARKLADYLDGDHEAQLGDVAYTLSQRRQALPYRHAVTGRDRAEVAAALRKVRVADAVAAAERGARVAFLFPGQGAQYAGMAAGLYRDEPAFAAEFDRCAALFAAEGGRDLRELLFGGAADADERLAQTEITQPALFSVEYALARLWDSLGVRPSAMAGHSIGEYTAACLAGVFSLPDAVRLVGARARLVQSMPPGAMLAVFLPEAEVAGWLAGELSLAAVNSTRLSVVSGPAAAVAELAQRLKAAKVSCRRLHTSHAFHSASMDGAVEPFIAAARSVPLQPPRLPFCSNVTGTWITAEEATSPEYWGRQLRQPVRFADCLTQLLSDPDLVLVEVGPGHTLSSFTQSHQAWRKGRTVTSSLRHPNGEVDDRVFLRRSLGAVWSAGAEADLAALDPAAPDQASGRQVLPLPGYAFQGDRYWVEPDAAGAVPAPSAPASAGRAAGSPADWFYAPSWHRQPAGSWPGEPPEDGDGTWWVVLADRPGLGQALTEELGRTGAEVREVGPGPEFAAPGGRPWSAGPGNRADFARLVQALEAEGAKAIRFVHLLSLADGPGALPPGDKAARAQLAEATSRGFDSLLALAQGIGDAHPAATTSIDVLCHGVQNVTGTEPLRPQDAPLLGLATVIPQELPGVSCRTLDITGASPGQSAASVVMAVSNMLRRPTRQRELALRGRYWWFRDFDRVSLETRPGGATRLRDGGVYLITGGLGGIGLALAEQITELAERPVLALLSRTGLPPEQEWDAFLAADDGKDPRAAVIQRLTRLRERGARLVICRGDVTDAEQTAGHVAALRASFGAINGVIHAAGAPSTGMIAGKTSADAARVLAAKTHGTLALSAACGQDDLDFFLLCSSVTAVLGGPGQSDYCAANTFLDVWAQAARQRGGTPVTSVNWGTWSGVGMAAGLGPQPGGAAEGVPTRHPLLRRVTTTGNARTYATTFSTADSWIVADHRLMGHGLVPGTAYLDLVHAAVAEQAGDQVIELHNVLFIAPVIVPDGQARTVYTTIEERDGRLEFSVRSRAEDGAGWREHATGWASVTERPADVVVDLASLRARSEITEVVRGEQDILHRARMDRYATGQLTFKYGPRWQVVQAIEIGRGQLLATLELPADFRPDLDHYPLHPAMLDMAVGIFRLDVDYPYYLPLGYRGLRVLHPLTGTVYCHATLPAPAADAETLSCDLELLDGEGRLLAQVTEYSVRRVNDIPAMAAQVERAVAAAAAGAGADDPPGESATASRFAALATGMSEADGKAAFARLLAAAELPEQLVVSAQDFTELRELARSVTPALMAEELASLAPSAGTHPRPELDSPYVAPGTAEEELVAAVWQEVLGVEPVGVHDDFFALGGHSLAAVQISTKIRSRTGTEPDLREFFSHPTVAHLAASLTAGGGHGDGTGAIEVVARQPYDGDLDDLPGEDLDRLSDDEVEARLRELLAADSDDYPNPA